MHPTLVAIGISYLDASPTLEVSRLSDLSEVVSYGLPGILVDMKITPCCSD